ncbi:MAG: putative CopG family antitoxin [Candidatus Nitrosomirales archaeon]|jgi:predicted CopG family antitoxin
MTKTISITDEAYEALVREKRDSESFADVIIRLTKRARLSDFAGIWKDIPESDLNEAEEKLQTLWTKTEQGY